jgi:hypothetical protein
MAEGVGYPTPGSLIPIDWLHPCEVSQHPPTAAPNAGFEAAHNTAPYTAPGTHRTGGLAADAARRRRPVMGAPDRPRPSAAGNYPKASGPTCQPSGTSRSRAPRVAPDERKIPGLRLTAGVLCAADSAHVRWILLTGAHSFGDNVRV